MRILATSDWHLDASTAGVDRFEDTRAAVQASVDAAIEKQVDFYLFGGDLSNPNTPRCLRSASTIITAFRQLEEAGVRPLAIAGNHDVIEDGDGWTTLSPLKAAFPRSTFEQPMMIELQGKLLFIALPFTATSHEYDPALAIEKMAKTKKKHGDLPVLIAGHLNLEGIGPGSETTDMPRGRDVFWPTTAIREHFPEAMVVGGHYHSPQEFDGVHIIGSLARLRFDECNNETGYALMEI